MRSPLLITSLLLLGAACGGAHHGASTGEPVPADVAMDHDAGGGTGSSASTAEDGGTSAPGAGTSTTGPTTPGAGGTDGGTKPTGACTSKQYWTPQTHHGPEMRPGEPCIECHQRMSTRLSVGGTVYPTLHEVDDCLGSNGGMQVVLTDAKGTQTVLAVNAAGNFYSTAAFAGPYHVKVVRGTTERAMVAPVSDGNCNACHTAPGAMGAPGRILDP